MSDQAYHGEGGASIGADAWGEATERERATATARLALLQAWRQVLAGPGGGHGRVRMTDDFVAAHRSVEPDIRLSRATLYAWDREERAGGIAGLLPRRRQEGESRIPLWAREMFGRLYLDQRKKPATVCYAIVEDEARRRGERIPGYAAFAGHAKRLPEALKAMMRQGEQTYHLRYAPIVLRDYRTYWPNDEWAADHTICNFWVRGREGHPVRPWKTEWQDLRSRRSLGAILYVGSPNTEAVLAAFGRAAERYGVPRLVRMDNSRDFSSPTFAGRSRRWRLSLDEGRIKGTLALLQVEARFTEPENPRGKGALERAFRTHEEWFDRGLPTYCGNSPKTRPEDLPERLGDRNGIPTVQEVDRLYLDYLDRVYNERPHEGQGMDGRSPREVYDLWLSGSLPAGVFPEGDPPARRTVTREELRFCCWKVTRPITVSRVGIRMFDRWYRWDGMSLWIGQEVYVRYNPGDLASLWVFDRQDRDVAVAVAQDLLGKGAGEADWRRLRRRKKFDAGVLSQAAEIRAAEREEPDLWRRYLDGRPEPPKPPRPKVLEPVRTGVRALAKVAMAAVAGGAAVPAPAPRSWVDSLLSTAPADPFAREED